MFRSLYSAYKEYFIFTKTTYYFKLHNMHHNYLTHICRHILVRYVQPSFKNRRKKTLWGNNFFSHRWKMKMISSDTHIRCFMSFLYYSTTIYRLCYYSHCYNLSKISFLLHFCFQVFLRKGKKIYYKFYRQ